MEPNESYSLSGTLLLSTTQTEDIGLGAKGEGRGRRWLPVALRDKDGDDRGIGGQATSSP